MTVTRIPSYLKSILKTSLCAATLFCTLITVSGCSSDREVSETIDLTAPPAPDAQFDETSDGPRGLSIPDLKRLEADNLSTVNVEAQNADSDFLLSDAPEDPFELSELSAGMSDGRVQIFSLDDPGADIPTTLPQQNVVADDGSVSLAAGFESRSGLGDVQGMPVNDNVLIFPLDGVLAPGIGAPLQMGEESFGMPFEPQSASGFIEVGSGNVMEKIFFNFGSSRLGSLDLQRLDRVAESYKANPTQMISVDGHASVKAQVNDKTQRQIVNLKESVNRAYKVARALIQRGVPAENIRLVAWGETRPPTDPGQRSAEAAARRVEIRPLTSFQ